MEEDRIQIIKISRFLNQLKHNRGVAAAAAAGGGGGVCTESDNVFEYKLICSNCFLQTSKNTIAISLLHKITNHMAIHARDKIEFIRNFSESKKSLFNSILFIFEE